MELTRRVMSLIVLGLVLLAVPAASAQEGGELPDEILIERPGFFPEGIEYDAEGERFLLGSLAEGTIFSVTDDGTIEPLIEDEELEVTVGIHLDAENGRLLVTNNDPSVFEGGEPDGPMSTLAAYDLETGERLFLADLSALSEAGTRHFANDVTVDAEGNAYVTDSFSPIIYRVDPEGNVSIFVQDDRFASETFGLNGLDFHPNGYLLVAKSDESLLFKVPLDDPAAFAPVEMETRPGSPDGIVLHPDGTLYVVGQPATVYALTSDDDWATAEVVDQAALAQSATTAAVRGDEVYVIFAHLDQMGSDTPPDVFEIVRAVFEE